MDAKDRQILSCLDEDSRTPYSLIARKTHSSQETVRYRVNNLLTEGIIERCITVINTPKLGFTPYQLFIKLQHADESQKDRMMRHLASISSINWIGNLEGNYDIGLIFSVRNQEETKHVLVQLYEKYSQWILKKTLALHFEGIFLPRQYLTKKPRIPLAFPHYTTTNATMELDDRDKIICSMLAKDARASLVDIAKKTGLTATGTHHRIKELKRKAIITKHLLILNNEKISQEHYKILLFLNNTTEERNRKLVAFAQEDPHVISLIKSLAEWDYEIDLEVEKRADITTFLKNLTIAHANIIRDYDIIRIKNMPKYTFYPEEKQTLNTPRSYDENS
jgi:DNA-binding Lrp family transcriptional regulator